MLQGINITLKSQLSKRHAAVAQGISKKRVKPEQNLIIRVLTSWGPQHDPWTRLCLMFLAWSPLQEDERKQV